MMLKKLSAILISLFMAAGPCFAASQWELDNIIGTTDPTNLDTVIQSNNDAIGRLNANYRRGCQIVPDTSAQVTILPCEIMICNSGGTDCEMRQTTSSTTVAWGDIDTGAEASSTQYYIYVTSDTDITGFVEKMSTSSSAPSGMTQYRKIGYFYNDSSSNIVNVGNVREGDSANSIQVSGTSDITLLSTSYTDMTDMTIYFVSSGRPVVMEWTGPLKDAGGGAISLVFDVDGTDYGGGRNAGKGLATDSQTSFSWQEVLSSGAHTIKVQWKGSGSTTYQNGSTIAPRAFTVKEL